MPGRKREFLVLARQSHLALSSMSEASMEEYMRELGCKFLPASRQQDAGFYLRLYPDLKDAIAPKPTDLLAFKKTI